MTEPFTQKKPAQSPGSTTAKPTTGPSHTTTKPANNQPSPQAVQQEILRNNAFVSQHQKEPAVLAAKLAEVINKAVKFKRMDSTVTQNVGPMVDKLSWWQKGAINTGADALLSRPVAQDISSGVTRKLTTVAGGDLYRKTINNDKNAIDIIKSFLQAIPSTQRPAVEKAFQQKTSKSLSATLGETIRDTNLRAPLMALLPPPMDIPTLTLDTFLEQLAVGMVYSNQTAEEMNTATTEKRRQSNPAALLSHFGYKAGPLILGRWGFQMRVFTPIPGKANKLPKAQPIVAFRGTEGVQFDVKGDGAAKKAQAEKKGVAETAQARQQGIEGTQDTIIGDASPTEVGWLQVQPNQELIARNLQRSAGKGGMYATGHSLGGAIAQIVTTLHPSIIREVVTFQSANIDQARVSSLKKLNQNPDTAITARHYRVDGDIVPTAGEAALPGDIYYFDRVSRPKGSNAPFSNSAAENIQAGHVTPMLTTYVRGQRTFHPDLKVLVENGLHDEATLKKDGSTPQKDVQSIFSGEYSTQQDPRIITESRRKLAARTVPAVLDDDPFEQVIYANLAYNTLLSHIENIAKDEKKIRNFDEFRKVATNLIYNQTKLKLDEDDVSMSKILKMDYLETDYDASPFMVGLMSMGTGQPTYPKKATPIANYMKDGIETPSAVRKQVEAQLIIIWNSWRGT